MNCLLCNRQVPLKLSWRELLRIGPLREETVCSHCWGQFAHYPEPHCRGCGRTTKAGQLCQECHQWKQELGWHLDHQCLYQYNDAMKEFMHRYKFQGDYRIRSVFTQAMAQQLDKYQADIITTVPIAQQTWLTRGFNQVQGIIDRPTEELLAVISNEKRPQSTRDRQERLALKQPFCWVDDKSRQSVYGKRVVLVDDVYTTGRTMYHAAGLFREAGVKSVKTFSLAG